jgi:hypothetical protein
MIDAAQGVVQAAGSVITQYPESLPTAPPAPACPSFTPNSEQRFTPDNSQNNRWKDHRAGFYLFTANLVVWCIHGKEKED